MQDINQFLTGKPLAKEFTSGQKPPDLYEGSLDMLEWYQKQVDRVTNPDGFKYRGTRMTMFHYWFLNFTPFMVAIKDKKGNVTDKFRVQFPYWCAIDDYIFKTMEDAFADKKGVFLMGGRGFGKTYIMLTVLAHIYQWITMSHSFVSATHDGHASECFNKMRDMLNGINEAHPMLAQNRFKDSAKLMQAGDEITTSDGRRRIEGSQSRIQKVVYGNQAGVTKGSRPDAQLIEEAADFATGSGNLKDCIAASEGSWKVGSIRKCKLMLIGTGGTVRSSEAKDVFMKPDAYGLIKCDVESSKKPCGLFIPTYYKYGGFYEKDGYSHWEDAKAHLDAERLLKQEDPLQYSKYCQEFPYTVDEVFRQQGTNIFNQDKIASQRAKLDFDTSMPIPEKGNFEWKKSTTGKIIGVDWCPNKNGKVSIIEHPEKSADGIGYKELYVIGVDSIDQGNADSVTTRGSKLAALCKKRISPNYITSSSSLYVCMYNERSDDVRDDYETVLQMAVYYNGIVNVEYTKIGIVSYFREQKNYFRLMKRPTISSGDASGEKHSNLIGTPASTHVIDHQDTKLKEYIDDNCWQIFFKELLEQCQLYQRENRTEYDLVIAAGLCELADEDKTGIVAKLVNKKSSDGLAKWGYYTDDEGYKRFGVVPSEKDNNLKFKDVQNEGPVRWIDVEDGNTLHFGDDMPMD